MSSAAKPTKTSAKRKTPKAPTNANAKRAKANAKAKATANADTNADANADADAKSTKFALEDLLLTEARLEVLAAHVAEADKIDPKTASKDCRDKVTGSGLGTKNKGVRADERIAANTRLNDWINTEVPNLNVDVTDYFTKFYSVIEKARKIGPLLRHFAHPFSKKGMIITPKDVKTMDAVRTLAYKIWASKTPDDYKKSHVVDYLRKIHSSPAKDAKKALAMINRCLDALATAKMCCAWAGERLVPLEEYERLAIEDEDAYAALTDAQKVPRFNDAEWPHLGDDGIIIKHKFITNDEGFKCTNKAMVAQHIKDLEDIKAKATEIYKANITDEEILGMD